MDAAAAMNPPGVTTEKVSEQFIKLYYRLLNECPEYLHQLYRDDSSAIVSEAQDSGPPCRVQAYNIEEIQQLVTMFRDVSVTITNCTPQCSLDGSLILLVTGKMVRKTVSDEDGSDTERLFTQAFVLAKQETGFYVLTDTLQVHSRGCTYKFLSKAQSQAQAKPEAAPAPQSLPPQNLIPEQEPKFASDPILPAGSHNNASENSALVQGESVQLSPPPQVEPNPARVQESQPVSYEHLVSAEETDSTPNNFAPYEPTSKKVVNPKATDTRKHVNKTDNAVPPPKPSYADIARKKKQMAAAAAAESHASKPQDFSFQLVGRRQKTSPAETNPPSQIPPQDSGWTQPSSVSVPADRQQEKSNVPGSPAMGSPSNRRLFVCRLPLGITAQKVAEIFSKFGEIVDPASVKLSSSAKNCFANIEFSTEAALQEALNAQIDIGSDKLIVERWHNRGKASRPTENRHGPGGRGGGQHRRRPSWEHV